jgi:Kef-type K+ transport system membrane component KefB
MFTNHIPLITYIGLLFVISQASGRIANYFKAPRIIGYFLAGILCGPYLLHLFSEDLVNNKLSIITNSTLSIIAFSIGGSLRLDTLNHLKKVILWIVSLQAFAAFFFVFIACLIAFPFVLGCDTYCWTEYISIALILGAISTATAPAPIMSIIHEYKAKGTFTTVLLGIISLDDALALMLYAFAIAFAQHFISGAEEISWYISLLIPLGKIFAAIALGVSVGFFLRTFIKFFFASRDVLLGIIIGFIFLTSGIAFAFDISPFLTNMAFGLVIANFIEHDRSDEIFDVIEGIEEPIFGAFFLLAGAHLNINVAWSAAWLSIILITMRFTGKLSGTSLGAHISHAEPPIRRYLGYALLPTAGLTIGLVLDANRILSPHLPVLCDIMVTAVIANTIINELLAPFFIRYSLSKAHDIK